MNPVQDRPSVSPPAPSNPDLVEAMRAVALQDDLETRRILYRALLESVLLVPTPEAPVDLADGGWTRLEEGTQVSLVTAQTPAGELALLAFTDTESLMAWKQAGTHYLALPAASLFRLAQQHGVAVVALNPAGPVGGQVRRQEIEMLARGVSPADASAGMSRVRLPQRTMIQVGPPAEPPLEELVQQWRQVLGQHPEVLAAYYFQLAAGEQEADPTVGLHLARELPRPAVDALMKPLIAVAQAARISYSLGFIVLEGEILEAVRGMVPAFWADGGQ